MKINSAVFLVESPMQLINAIEAKHHFSIQETYLLIRYDGIASNDQHMDYVLNTIDNKFSRISRFMLLYGKKNIFKMLKPLIWCLRYNPDYLFLGNFFSGYSRLVRMLYPNKKTFFLDDGAQTTKLYYDNKKINLFSYYYFEDIYPERIYVHHKFDFIKYKLSQEKKSVSENEIYFIGAAIVENNLITIDNFYKIFEFVTSYYKDYKITYLPHRFEDISKIQKYKNINILKPEMPIELFLLQANSLPVKIISYYSAALYTINSMLGDYIGVESFKIPYGMFNDSQYADRIEKLYNYFSQSMSVININEEI